jgi:hypothetical protein
MWKSNINYKFSPNSIYFFFLKKKGKKEKKSVQLVTPYEGGQCMANTLKWLGLILYMKRVSVRLHKWGYRGFGRDI